MMHACDFRSLHSVQPDMLPHPDREVLAQGYLTQLSKERETPKPYYFWLLSDLLFYGLRRSMQHKCILIRCYRLDECAVRSNAPRLRADDGQLIPSHAFQIIVRNKSMYLWDESAEISNQWYAQFEAATTATT